MAISPFQIFPGSTGAGPYTVSFELPGTFSGVVVKLLKDGDTAFVTQTVDVQYSFVRATKTVTFLAGFEPETGDTVRIERFTTRDRQIDYVSGQTLSERNLDNDTNRLTMVDQEIEADLLDALRRNAERDAWDGEGLPSENCGDAISAGGWITLRQLQAGGNLGVDISGATVFTLGPGDGFTTDYELIGAKNLTTAQVDAYLASVYQSSSGSVFEILNNGDSGYPTWALGDDVLSFLEPPTNGATIEVKIITGTVTNEVANNSIDTDQIKDDAVTEAKMHTALSGDTTRLFVADIAGDVTARQIGVADLLDTEDGDLASGVVRSAIINDIRISDFVNPASAAVAMGGNFINDLATAIFGSSPGGTAANKSYVDSRILSVTPSTARFATGLLPAIVTTGILTVNATYGLSFVPDVVLWWKPATSGNYAFVINTVPQAVLMYARSGPSVGGLSGATHAQVMQLTCQIGIGQDPYHAIVQNIASIGTSASTGFLLRNDHLSVGPSAYLAIKV